jgi:predicted O-methyltransferase YrrM
MFMDDVMDKQLLRLLLEIEEYGRANDARESDRARKMLNLDSATARLVSILVRSSGATQVLEVGTSNGYSTIWLAWAVSVARGGVPRAGTACGNFPSGSLTETESPAEAAVTTPVPRAFPSRVTSIDRNPDKQALARENLRRAGLLDRVDLLHGDATEVIRELSGPFDFVFFDADRTGAPAQLHLLLPKLAAKAFVLHDNALSHPDEIATYLKLIDSLPEFQHTVVPVGKGLSIAFRG